MSDSLPPRLSELIGRATAADGSPPFSDGALVELARGTRDLVWGESAAALVSPTEAEFVVDPDARGRGHGTAMLETLGTDERLFWAHGDHPAARALAASHGLEAVRTLLHLEAAVRGAGGGGISTGSIREGSIREGSIREGAIRVGDIRLPLDAEVFLELNARAFAHHPEQGGMTRDDLDVVAAEPWFDPADFLLLWDGPTLIGYSWMKIVGDEGEFYVVGVDPDRQGQGLGRRLVQEGFAHLAARGIRTAHLYVEGDNAPALALYRSFGFTDRSVDIQYARRP